MKCNYFSTTLNRPTAPFTIGYNVAPYESSWHLLRALVMVIKVHHVINSQNNQSNHPYLVSFG